MMEVDFLPNRIRTQRIRKSRLIVRGYLLAICLAGLAVLGYMFQSRVRTAQAELTMLSARGDAMARQLILRDSLEDELADVMIKKRIEEQLGRRVGTLDVLGELQRVMPESMALTDLTMETVTVAAPAGSAGGANQSNRAVSGAGGGQKTIKRVRVVITGMAPTDVDVANFIGQLAGSRVFEDVNMGYARNVPFRTRTARKFQVSCYVIR